MFNTFQRIRVIKFLTILYLVTFLISCNNTLPSDLPSKVPELNVTIDNINFIATKNEYNWSKDKTGSSNLGFYAIERAKEIDGYKATPNSTIHLALTYDNEIKTFSVQQITGTSKDNFSSVAIPIDQGNIKLPSENGEYVYAVYASWDDTHSAEYIFKVNI